MVTPQMVNEAAKGDQDMIAQIYMMTYSEVYATVMAYTSGSDISQDVTQDAFIKAFSSLDQLKNGFQFTAWVKSIARNTAVDTLRHNQRSTPFSQFDADEGTGDKDDDSEAFSEIEDEKAPVPGVVAGSAAIAVNTYTSNMRESGQEPTEEIMAYQEIGGWFYTKSGKLFYCDDNGDFFQCTDLENIRKIYTSEDKALLITYDGYIYFYDQSADTLKVIDSGKNTWMAGYYSPEGFLYYCMDNDKNGSDLYQYTIATGKTELIASFEDEIIDYILYLAGDWFIFNEFFPTDEKNNTGTAIMRSNGEDYRLLETHFSS